MQIVSVLTHIMLIVYAKLKEHDKLLADHDRLLKEHDAKLKEHDSKLSE